MKKFLLSIALLCSMCINAQTTYSRYDVNHDGNVTIEDITWIANNILGKANVPITSITLSSEESSLSVGATTTITAAIKPSDADIQELSWNSSDNSVATVDQQGVVTAISEGSVTISANSTDGSNVSSSITLDIASVEQHEYVDLGLPSGTLWATCNVGAEKPEDYGLYFAWGETTGYTSNTSDGHSYNWASTPFNDGNSSYSSTAWAKYSSTVLDASYNLVAAYDAATVNWGSSWRMPTNDEWTELKENCTWTWTTENGIKGYKVDGTNGNSIFLPAAGWRKDRSIYSAGIEGYYWSSSLYTNDPRYAYGIYYSSGSVYNNSTDGHYYGHNVRPVSK